MQPESMEQKHVGCKHDAQISVWPHDGNYVPIGALCENYIVVIRRCFLQVGGGSRSLDLLLLKGEVLSVMVYCLRRRLLGVYSKSHIGQIRNSCLVYKSPPIFKAFLKELENKSLRVWFKPYNIILIVELQVNSWSQHRMVYNTKSYRRQRRQGWSGVRKAK